MEWFLHCDIHYWNMSIAIYAISFAQYAISVLGFGHEKLIAIGILTVLYLLNLFGIDKFAKVQNIVVIVLLLSLILFSVFCVSKVDPDYFSDSFMPKGVLGIFTTGAFLTFATGGAGSIVNFSAEAKNPKKDIPRVIIISSLFVALIYAFMATIASGVLPVADVAGKPLTDVAKTILPKGLYIFFVVGGAMFALVSTLNAQLAWCTKPLLQACVDGWLPKKLAKVHSKFKTPIILLTIMYVIGLIPIIFNLEIGDIGSSVVIVQELLVILLSICMLRLDKKIPELWRSSSYYMKQWKLVVLAVIAILACIFQTILLWKTLSPTLRIANAVLIVLAFVFAHFRYASGKTNMEVSYEKE